MHSKMTRPLRITAPGESHKFSTNTTRPCLNRYVSKFLMRRRCFYLARGARQYQSDGRVAAKRRALDDRDRRSDAGPDISEQSDAAAPSPSLSSFPPRLSHPAITHPRTSLFICFSGQQAVDLPLSPYRMDMFIAEVRRLACRPSLSCETELAY